MVQGETQHHGRAQDGGQGIGNAFARDVRRTAVAGFVEALVFAVQTGRRQHANRACEHRGFVTQDIAKHIAGHHHVKTLGLFDQLHGGVVHIHMVKGDVRVLLAHFADHIFPELEGFEHVGFVHACDTAFGACGFAFARGLESDMGDTLDLGLAVTHGVERFLGAGEVPVCCNTTATRLPKVNITREFADDQNI